jgi:hypothetical protein
LPDNLERYSLNLAEKMTSKSFNELLENIPTGSTNDESAVIEGIE